MTIKALPVRSLCSSTKTVCPSVKIAWTDVRIPGPPSISVSGLSHRPIRGWFTDSLKAEMQACPSWLSFRPKICTRPQLDSAVKYAHAYQPVCQPLASAQHTRGRSKHVTFGLYHIIRNRRTHNPPWVFPVR